MVNGLYALPDPLAGFNGYPLLKGKEGRETKAGMIDTLNFGDVGRKTSLC